MDLHIILNTPIPKNIVSYHGLDAPKVLYEKLKEESLNIAKNYLYINKPMKELNSVKWKKVNIMLLINVTSVSVT